MHTDHYEDSDESEKDSDSSSEMEQVTANLPKSIFPKDPKPGKKCTFEVVAVRGDEVEVKYSSSKDDDKEDDDEDDSDDDKPKRRRKRDDDDDDTVSVAVREEADPFARYDTEA